MERVKGIEPSQPAWKAGALPLSYTRKWSGKRDSNSRPSPWQGDALPLSHFRKWWGEKDSNLRSRRQRIYSPSPLAARESPLVLNLPAYFCVAHLRSVSHVLEYAPSLVPACALNYLESLTQAHKYLRCYFEVLIHSFRKKKWRPRRDSNPRPPA